MKPAYYNEIDPYAAAWLRNLIAARHIADGDVDERSIVDVRPADLRGYSQCHFFAGIGGWSYALRLAGWPDDRPVWTGSCPCQPFSAAGKGKAADDERHLWPAWFSLIRECKPATIFGEQVEAAIGWGWLDFVFADLEAESYAVGAAVLPACGVGAPHIRQRLWFVGTLALTERTGIGRVDPKQTEAQRPSPRDQHIKQPHQGCGWSDFADDRDSRILAHSNGRDASAERLQRGREQRQQPEDGRSLQLDDTIGKRWRAGRGDNAEYERIVANANGELGHAAGDKQRQSWIAEAGDGWPRAIGRSSPWSNCDWLPCTDGKARPVESGTFPLAHGIPGRVGRLRAYGNAIIPQIAASFIAAMQRPAAA